MPIDSLLKDRLIEPEVFDRLKLAYETALRALHLVDRNDPIAEIVARKIIEIGLSGPQDPAEISARAVEELRIS